LQQGVGLGAEPATRDPGPVHVPLARGVGGAVRRGRLPRRSLGKLPPEVADARHVPPHAVRARPPLIGTAARRPPFPWSLLLSALRNGSAATTGTPTPRRRPRSSGHREVRRRRRSPEGASRPVPWPAWSPACRRS